MDEGSILDKILHSKEQEEIELFKPQETVETLLKYLGGREKDVLRRRFGLLNGGAEETLEAIGSSYKVTRERIRQIEKIAIRKILKLKQFHQILDPLLTTITSVLQKNGGVMREDLLLHELLRLSGDTPESQQCVLFLMEKIFSTHFQRIEASKGMYTSWKLPNISISFVESTIDKLVEIADEKKKPLRAHDLVSSFKDKEFYKEHQYQLSDDALFSYLDITKRLAKNPYEEYGKSEWGSVAPKRMNDKIFLVLKKHGKPCHFTDITKMINDLKFDDKPAYAPTVHNELILNKEYVLVGRGIYALKEWGYKPGVVADVITDVLSSNGNPMSRQEIVTEVLKRRVVKKNTIHLALTDKHKFQKLSDGRYAPVRQL